MLSPRWRKVLADLWLNKTRTILVVLSIAVGVFAIGAIMISQGVLSKDITASYMATNPSNGMIYTGDAFDDDLVKAVRGMREVGEAEARSNITMRLQVGPEEWRNIAMIAISDYKDIRINKIRSQSGDWPPPEHQLLIERSALSLTNAKEGDTLRIKTNKGKIREMRIAGVVHDLSQMPAMFDGTVYAYVTFDTLQWLGESRDYNEMNFTVAENGYDKEHITEVAKRIQRKIERSGRPVFYTMVKEPGRHMMQDAIDTMLLLLGVLGGLSLILSGFLIVNTISAILAQQIRQIGIMKSIGARSNQVTGMYMSLVLIFGLLALFVAVPLGALSAWAFSGFMAGLFNFDLTSFSVPLEVLGVQFAISMIVPVLAAGYPVFKGTRVTAREAMSDYGLGQVQFGKGRLDRLLERVRGLSRPVLLSLRNTFRRKGRLALTLLTLTLGGAIFISVFAVQASLLLTLDDLLKVWNYDIGVMFNKSYRLEEVEEHAMAVPGVADAIGTYYATARRVREDDTESGALFVFGPPEGSNLVNPVISKGRYLLPEDENAIVVTSNFLKDEPDIELGDDITLKIDGKESKWRLVGISQWLIPIAYVNYSYLARTTADMGVSFVSIVTERHDMESQNQVARELERYYDEVGLNVSYMEKMAEERAQVEMQFNIITVLLLIMAVLMAVVGGLGLMGTMSINVLERTREIGVMRAIGASDGAVVQVFLVEGVIIGLLSWLIGTVVALPLSKLLSDAVGIAFMQAPLSYTFSMSGVAIWFIVVVIVAAIASFIPSRSASRITVREVLAYE